LILTFDFFSSLFFLFLVEHSYGAKILAFTRHSSEKLVIDLEKIQEEEDGKKEGSYSSELNEIAGESPAGLPFLELIRLCFLISLITRSCLYLHLGSWRYEPRRSRSYR